MSEPTTEMIDRLYLELSQFTHATTKREAELQAEIAALRGMIEVWQREVGGRDSEIAALREAVRCASGALPPEQYPYWHGLPCVVRALRGKEWSVCGSELP